MQKQQFGWLTEIHYMDHTYAERVQMRCNNNILKYFRADANDLKASSWIV